MAFSRTLRCSPFQTSRSYSRACSQVEQEDRGAIQELNSALNGYRAGNVNRLVIIDEVNSGRQMSTALKRVKKWQNANRVPDLSVLALGMTELNGSARANKQRELAEKYPWAMILLVHVPSLMGYDDKGVPIKPVMNIGTQYIPYRFWGGGYEVRCKNTLTDCSFRLVAASDTASGYSSTLRAICCENPQRPQVCWPEKACSDCAAKIAEIRRLYAALPKLEQYGTVVGKVADRGMLLRSKR